jgi:predicted ArsR family transcriptional regulator
MARDTHGPGADGPPKGTERWKEATTAFDRTVDVSTALDSPQTAGWIAEEAHVSESTTRKYLDMLVDLGVVASTTAHGVTKYRPDPTWLRFQQISEFVERYSREELLEKVEAFKTQIDTAKDRYDAETPDELRSRAAAEDTPTDEVREIGQVASEWESVQQQLDLLEEALERYDEFTQGSVTA